MSSRPITEGAQKGNMNPAPLVPKPSTPAPAQGGTKHAEIESIRRTLYNALNKLDQLQGNLKTT